MTIEIALLIAVSLVIWFFIMRWVFRITAIVDRLNASVLLLSEIAIKSGVQEYKIKSILDAHLVENNYKGDTTGTKQPEIAPSVQ